VICFPENYIHIGGDEGFENTMEKVCESCQQLIQQFNLKDEEGLQSYFIRRIDTYSHLKTKTTRWLG
jgi:hexosaminidase